MIDLGVLALAYVLSHFYRTFLAVLAPDLMAELQIGPGVMSNAAGAYFIVFAVAQLPVGLALDRIGPRRTAGWLFLICAAGGALVFALAEGGSMLVLASGLVGLGCAPILMASMYLIARRYSPTVFATFSGVMIGLGSLGNVAGAAPLAWGAEAFGWRPVMLFVGALTAVIALALLILIRDPERIDDPTDRGARDFLTVLKIPGIWLVIPLLATNYAAPAGIRGLWAGPYLADVYDLTVVEIGQATLWMALAMAAGSFLYAPLDRIFGTQKWVVWTGNAFGALAILGLATLGLSAGGSIALLVAIGLFCASYAVVMAYARNFFPTHLIGRGTTMMNFFSIGGVGVGQIVTGRIAESFADPASPEAYAAIFTYYAAVVGVALAVFVFAENRRP